MIYDFRRSTVTVANPLLTYHGSPSTDTDIGNGLLTRNRHDAANADRKQGCSQARRCYSFVPRRTSHAVAYQRRYRQYKRLDVTSKRYEAQVPCSRWDSFRYQSRSARTTDEPSLPSLGTVLPNHPIGDDWTSITRRIE
jgi:hypothetical protein